MATSSYTTQMELALDDLAQQNKPNFLGTAKKYGVPRTTLRDRFTGKTQSRQDAISEHHNCLTTAQEEALITQINRLANRGLPPTNSIVKSLAEEVIGRPVGKNWSSQFVACY